MLKTGLFYCALSLALFASGCGGGAKNSGGYGAGASSPAASPAARGGGAGMAAAAAPIPSNLHCGATQPVWVNPKRRVYHLASDPYYGRTKHGEYMCPSQAAKEGYHAAGGGSMRKHHRKSGNMMQAQPSPSPGY